LSVLQQPLPGIRERRKASVALLLALVILLASFGLGVLALWPQLDLDVARLFLSSDPRQFQDDEPLVQYLRSAASILPFVVFFARLGWQGLKRKGNEDRTQSRSSARSISAHSTQAARRQTAFLILSLALGPGLLVNSVLKEHFHRPRPAHVEEFGGQAAFQPFYQAVGGCEKNCSFPSGETAAAFWTLAPALLVQGPLRLPAVALALAFGLGTGLLRMAAGAHFLSDVLASGVLMTALIAMLWILLRPDRREDLTAGGLRPKQASL